MSAAGAAAPAATWRRTASVLGRLVRTGLVLAALFGACFAAWAVWSGYKPLVVLTGSMRPTISPGDLVIAQAEPALRAVRPGQVVTFSDPKHGSRTITHRVLAVKRLKGGQLNVTTQGDANPLPEHWLVNEQGTVGRTVLVVPKLGLYAQALLSVTGRQVVIIGACLLLLLTLLWWIWSSGRERKPRRWRRVVSVGGWTLLAAALMAVPAAALGGLITPPPQPKVSGAAGAPLFSAAGVSPGWSQTRCVAVGPDHGTLSDFGLYGRDIHGSLAKALQLKVSAGSGVVGPDHGCEHFVPRGTLYSGTLQNYPLATRALTDRVRLGPGARATYRFQITLPTGTVLAPGVEHAEFALVFGGSPYRVDIATTFINAGPAAMMPTNTRRASFRFGADRPALWYTCALDRRPRRCTDRYRTPKLRYGRHRIEVAGHDHDGTFRKAQRTWWVVRPPILTAAPVAVVLDRARRGWWSIAARTRRMLSRRVLYVGTAWCPPSRDLCRVRVSAGIRVLGVGRVRARPRTVVVRGGHRRQVRLRVRISRQTYRKVVGYGRRVRVVIRVRARQGRYRGAGAMGLRLQTPTRKRRW